MGYAMKRDAKRVVKALEQRGYSYARRNAKGHHVYALGGREVIVNMAMSEAAARRVLTDLGEDLGKGNKRNPARVKARQEHDRQRIEAEIARLERERAEFRQRATLRWEEARRIEAIERELRYWQQLMTEVPASGKHRGRGRARHQSGGAS